MFSSLTKMHLGNMSQKVSVTGSSSFDLAGNTPPVESARGRGLLVQENGGTLSQDSFAFVPEANLKPWIQGLQVHDCKCRILPDALVRRCTGRTSHRR